VSVYVDGARNKFGRMQMSHMIADTTAELHEMADKIGLPRKWFQPYSMPHYDVCKSKRDLALLHGAIEVDRRQLGAILKRMRDEILNGQASFHR
jgi:hypothetical protein